MEHQIFLNWGKIFEPSEINTVIDDRLKESRIIKTNKKIEYFNVPCSFDIETTSFFRSTGNEQEKAAIMYEWTLGLNGVVIIGRTWEEFLFVVNTLIERLDLWDYKRLIIYVHNLAFEFQFMRKLFEWKNVFSLDTRKPLYALTVNGIEFRCSYLLSGYSLKKLGDELQKYPVQKMVGDLDYKLIHHSKTELTEKELKYCENDARVVMSYIQERIEEDGNITRIPLTKTGYVRDYARNECMYSGSHKKNARKYINFRKVMDGMRISPEEYMQLKRAFQGGFTHASAWKSGKVIENVGSFDFTSSYPAVMVAEKFPMSSCEIVEIKTTQQFYENLKLYCCLFDVEIFNIESKTLIEHPLSISRCSKVQVPVEDNGRIVSAQHLCTTWTEQDFLVMRKFYKWESIKIGNFRRYKKGYLPTDFIKAILKLYQDKTTLKNVQGKEIEYLKSKEMINACYGMAVTDICRDEITYSNEEWSEEKANIIDSLNKYNRSKRRFLFYPWGVWVTAYARKNLFTGIMAFGEDYVYSDTDSIKGVNIEKHRDYIDEYNNRIIAKLEAAMKFHGIESSAYRPKTIKGIEKILGVWDEEEPYTKFKTLGAKRYMTEQHGEISLTVSGINKKECVPYLVEKYKTPERIFSAFSNELYIPSRVVYPNGKIIYPTGKNIHTYVDYPVTGEITDYRGVTAKYYEASGVHLIEADYSLSLSVAYADYLRGIQTFEN
jgi:hypothetical protein